VSWILRAQYTFTIKLITLSLADMNSAHETWASLSELAELVEAQAKNRSEFIEECRSGSLDNVLATYRTFASISTTGLFDEELIKELPKTLKFVCHNGVCFHLSFQKRLNTSIVQILINRLT
jgi:hypothetical protein